MSAGPTHLSPARAVPPPRSGPTIPRPTLERRLDEGARRRLTAVLAGAGFGKSTLLSEWAATRTSAWYSLSIADRELGVLTSGLVDALRLRVPTIAPAIARPFGGLRGPDADSDVAFRAQAHAAVLCDALETHLTRELVLVLDDVDRLRPEDAAARFIEALCLAAPPLLRLVMASREDLPFPISRLRGQGQALEPFDVGGVVGVHRLGAQLPAESLVEGTDEWGLLREFDGHGISPGTGMGVGVRPRAKVTQVCA